MYPKVVSWRDVSSLYCVVICVSHVFRKVHSFRDADMYIVINIYVDFLEYPLAERPGQPLARSSTLFKCLSNFAATGSIVFGTFLCRCRVVYAEQFLRLSNPYV